jgi:hypothetical protein
VYPLISETRGADEVVVGTTMVAGGSALESVEAVAGGVVEDVGAGFGDGASVTVTSDVAAAESEVSVLVLPEPSSHATSDTSKATTHPTSAICWPIMRW